MSDTDTIDTDVDLCWLCGHLATTHHPAANQTRACTHPDCRCTRETSQPWRRCKGTAQLLETRPVLRDVDYPDFEFLPGSTCWQIRQPTPIVRGILVLGLVPFDLDVMHVMWADDTATVLADGDDHYDTFYQLDSTGEAPDRYLLESTLGRLGYRALF